MHDLQVRACIKRKEFTKTIWWHTSVPYMQNKICDKFRNRHPPPSYMKDQLCQHAR